MLGEFGSVEIQASSTGRDFPFICALHLSDNGVLLLSGKFNGIEDRDVYTEDGVIWRSPDRQKIIKSWLYSGRDDRGHLCTLYDNKFTIGGYSYLPRGQLTYDYRNNTLGVSSDVGFNGLSKYSYRNLDIIFGLVFRALWIEAKVCLDESNTPIAYDFWYRYSHYDESSWYLQRCRNLHR